MEPTSALVIEPTLGRGGWPCFRFAGCEINFAKWDRAVPAALGSCAPEGIVARRLRFRGRGAPQQRPSYIERVLVGAPKMSNADPIVIVSAVRTPLGRFL